MTGRMLGYMPTRLASSPLPFALTFVVLQRQRSAISVADVDGSERCARAGRRAAAPAVRALRAAGLGIRAMAMVQTIHPTSSNRMIVAITENLTGICY